MPKRSQQLERVLAERVRAAQLQQLEIALLVTYPISAQLLSVGAAEVEVVARRELHFILGVAQIKTCRFDTMVFAVLQSEIQRTGERDVVRRRSRVERGVGVARGTIGS